MQTNLSTFLQDAEQFNTIPLVKQLFIDTLTPIQMYHHFKEDAVFILESQDEQSPWSRYSFLGLNPFLFLDYEDDQFYLKDTKKNKLKSYATFQTAFEETTKYLQLKVPETDIPFKGGAVGFMGYDAISTIEKVSKHKHNDLNMKAYSFMYCETILAFDHHKKELVIFHYVRLTGDENEEDRKVAYEKGSHQLERVIQQLLTSQVQHEQLSAFKTDEEVSFNDIKSNFKKEEFIEAVEKIKEYIRAGDIFQAVLSQRFEMDVTVSGFQLYRVLRLVNPSPYLFYIKVDDVEIVGSSPERLIQIENGHLEIHPIAGTRRRGRTKEEDIHLGEELLQDEKEQAEHYMLVDLARNDIGRSSKFGSVKTPVLMELGRFSHVMHLISKVTGELREGTSPIQALNYAFPAGTVSGAPKIRAMEILSELEPQARNLYAGTVAYLGYDGNIDSCIAIRTIILKDKKAYVQAGAGVVNDSIPELEYKETRNKASALIKAIQLAEKVFSTSEERKEFIK